MWTGDADEYAATEAEVQLPVFDVSDDELERAAARDGRQAITWAYCTNSSWPCPL